MVTTQLATSSISSSIDLIARSIASLLLLIYGLGFVILAFHDARYGVVQFSPFRARILLVGFVFASLVALAAAAQHYGFLFIAPLDSVRNDSDIARQKQRDAVLAGGFLFTASFMASVVGFFLFSSSPSLPSGRKAIILWFALYALEWAIFSLVNRIFVRRPFLAVCLSLFAFTLFFVSIDLISVSRTWGGLAAFIFFVGWQTVTIKRSDNLVKYVSCIWNFASMLLVLWIYIFEIFGSLPPRWGGGQPTPVMIFQINPTPLSTSNPVGALLLDETDQGFYILLSADGKAFFIPRSNVASIFFGSKGDFAGKTP